MRIKKTKVYKFEELSDAAKNHARDRYRANSYYEVDLEHLTDEFVTILHAFGFRPEKAKHARRPGVYWSTNPIGAAFSSTWSSERAASETCRAARAAAASNRPSDKTLADMADAIDLLIGAYPHAYGSTTAGGRDGLSQVCELHHGEDDTEGDIDEPAALSQFETIVTDLAHWFALKVDAEEQWITSDEYIDDLLIANDYEFDEEGNPE